jgi:phosphoglycerate dehydrogenase-like enzyme
MPSRGVPLPRADGGKTRVVLHPVDLPGVREALSAVNGIELLCPADDDEVTEALRAAPVLVTRRWRADYLQQGLRWVQTLSAGYEQFPVETLRAAGVALSTASGLHAVVAEHAIGLLLTLTRDIHRSMADATGRRWNPHDAAELAGRTIVLAGLGAIGEAIARRLEPWDVRLIAVTRTPGRRRGNLNDVRPLSGLVQASREASALIVCLALSPETLHLVSDEVLDALGPGWVVNVSRGAVVYEPALVARLADGRLRGAGLDVFGQEPLPAEASLWELPNVVCTPHMAGMSPRYALRLAELLAHNLLAFDGRAPWRNRVC